MHVKLTELSHLSSLPCSLLLFSSSSWAPRVPGWVAPLPHMLRICTCPSQAEARADELNLHQKKEAHHVCWNPSVFVGRCWQTSLFFHIIREQVCVNVCIQARKSPLSVNLSASSLKVTTSPKPLRRKDWVAGRENTCSQKKLVPAAVFPLLLHKNAG